MSSKAKVVLVEPILITGEVQPVAGPIEIHSQMDTAAVCMRVLGGTGLLVAIMLCWLKLQLVSRGKARASRAAWAKKMEDPNALKILSAYREHQKEGQDIAAAIEKAGLKGYLGK